MVTRELEQQKLLAQAIERYHLLSRDECFDPYDPESRPTELQTKIYKDCGIILYRWVIGGNRGGKTSTPPREISWILENKHPYWQRPASWGHEPLTIIIAGQDRKMMELAIWEKKLKPFLVADDWKEVRQGMALQYVTHRVTKDQIIFISHADSSERNRKFMQGYKAHYVWLDEMPGSFAILEELQRRVDDSRGPFIATFTPKAKNIQIQKIVDSARAPIARKYFLPKLSNPIFKGREAEEIAKLAGYSDAYKKTVLEGAWLTGEDAVYNFDPEKMMQPLPDNYSHQWRHVESSDPALKSKFGFTLWAEDPSNGMWYLVRSEYIEGLYDPQSMYERIQTMTRGYNIVRRVCDPHEVWYLSTAASNKCQPAYTSPYKKNQRKGELIKGLQAALGVSAIIPPHNDSFLEEINECRWSESQDDRIVNASSYHLLDSAQYFIDCAPKWDGPSQPIEGFHQWLYESNEKRKTAESKARKQEEVRKQGWRVRRIGRPSKRPNGRFGSYK